MGAAVGAEGYAAAIEQAETAAAAAALAGGDADSVGTRSEGPDADDGATPRGFLLPMVNSFESLDELAGSRGVSPFVGAAGEVGGDLLSPAFAVGGSTGAGAGGGIGMAMSMGGLTTMASVGGQLGMMSSGIRLEEGGLMGLTAGGGFGSDSLDLAGFLPTDGAGAGYGGPTSFLPAMASQQAQQGLGAQHAQQQQQQQPAGGEGGDDEFGGDDGSFGFLAGDDEGEGGLGAGGEGLGRGGLADQVLAGAKRMRNASLPLLQAAVRPPSKLSRMS